MSALTRLNREVKNYDRNLSVIEVNGIKTLVTKMKRYLPFEVNGESFKVLVEYPFELIHFTDTLNKKGVPHEFGIEFLRSLILKADEQRHEGYEEFNKKRELEEYDRQRQRKNHFNAVAADMRKDFAKVFDDVNTGSMSKNDLRKLGEEKNGYY